MRNLIFLCFAVISCAFFSCTKTVTEVKTVVEKDTVYVHDTTTIPALISDTTTTCIVIRHAEKESTGTDPNLDSDGMLRAEELKRILSNVPVQAVYSTPFNRTRQTAQPLANAKGLAVTEYAVATPYAQLVGGILSANRGKVILIVGHSNTVPEILKELSDNSFNVTIAESQYDHLFIVNLPDKLSPKVMHMKYGKETP